MSDFDKSIKDIEFYKDNTYEFYDHIKEMLRRMIDQTNINDIGGAISSAVDSISYNSNYHDEFIKTLDRPPKSKYNVGNRVTLIGRQDGIDEMDKYLGGTYTISQVRPWDGGSYWYEFTEIGFAWNERWLEPDLYEQFEDKDFLI